MKTDSKSLLMFAAFFNTTTNVVLSYFYQNGANLIANVPSLGQAVSWTSAYGSAVTRLGGHYGGFFGIVLNFFSYILSWPLGAVIWLGNIIGWVAGMVGWVFSFASPPFYLAFGSRAGSILAAMMWLIIGAALLFSIRGPTGVGLEP